ncbi:MAG: peptidylprolyl isomerase [Candidatus Eisenbacteria bacterium]|nr:peptidylprolyl isomerase [Candidatus Eisenbacteria bacterium]
MKGMRMGVPVGILLALALSFGCGKSDKGAEKAGAGSSTEPISGDSTKVVATVGDEPIVLGEVNQVVSLWRQGGMPGTETMSERQLQDRAIDNLIDQHVLFQAATAAGKVPTDDQVEQIVQSLRGQFPTPEAFQQAMQQRGMNEKTLRVNIRTDMAIRQYLMSEVPDTIQLTPADAQKYYAEHPEQFEQVHASHILIRADSTMSEEARRQARETAASLLARIRAGEDFAAIARASSQDSLSARQGGDLGTFGHGQLNPTFEQAAFSLEPGQVSEVVETSIGFHIIRVEEKNKVPYDPRLEGSLINYLHQQKQNEAVQKRVEDLKSKASIERKV